MNCQSARDVFPALLDPRSEATAHLDARQHLANCPDCQREFAAVSQTAAALDAMITPPPSPRLRQNFYAMLEEEKHSAASIRASARREHRASLWRWILAPAMGGALLVAGFVAGQRAQPADTPAAVSPETLAMRQEIRDLRNQVEKNNVLVTYSILQQEKGPTNERLQEVLAAAKAANPSDKTLDTLINAAAFDPSVHVRSRALEALLPHADRDIVRKGVVWMLPREQNPLVQIDLIDFLAASDQADAAPLLEQMSRNEQIDVTVREAARRAHAQVSILPQPTP